MPSIKKILIANRGEVSARVARSCRRLGITSVGVYSDVDAGAPYLEACDEAFSIGGESSSESYLRGRTLVATALRGGCDAVHPGYGFLSEDAAFARLCEEAGLVFIGPRPETLEAFGSKTSAKELAEAAQIPVVPGYSGAYADRAELAAEIRKMGFPALVKAVSGGGGRGIRQVHRDSDLEAELESAEREAIAAFDTGLLYAERYIEVARHIEVQILGDGEGGALHAFERECSIQRRHQKVIEEAPAPGIDEALRSDLCAAALRLVKAAKYRGAGTVEFLVEPDGTYYFIELNARLQVEHPVTEQVTGLDLVAEQIRIAQGAGFSVRQDELALKGHALECRIYAEDPSQGFFPRVGEILDFHLAGEVRVETASKAGTVISPHYDALVAKLISTSETRGGAIATMTASLQQSSILGVHTNMPLLRALLGHPCFTEGEVHTSFLEENWDALRPQELPELPALAATVWAFEKRRSSRTRLPHLEPGYRNSRYGPERHCYLVDQREINTSYVNLREGVLDCTVGDSSHQVRVLTFEGPSLHLEIDGKQNRFRVCERDSHFYVHSSTGSCELIAQARYPAERQGQVQDGLVSPLPGVVVAVPVEPGLEVEAGTIVAVVEAMKMEHSIVAPDAGTVRQVLVEKGQQVSAQQLVAIVD